MYVFINEEIAPKAGAKVYNQVEGLLQLIDVNDDNLSLPNKPATADIVRIVKNIYKAESAHRESEQTSKAVAA